VHFRYQHVVIPLRLRDFNSYKTSPFILPKVFITGGKNDIENGIKNTYIFDKNETSKVPDLPEGIFGAASVLYNNTPISCGGKKIDGEITSDCFQFNGELWVEFPSLQKPRIGSKMISYETQLIITGGGNDLSTEVFNGDSWINGPEMLRSLSYHCIVFLDDNGKFLLIGGKKFIYVFDWKSY